jgi:hypothetical protein
MDLDRPQTGANDRDIIENRPPLLLNNKKPDLNPVFFWQQY